MSSPNDEFLAMLRATFKLEAEEHLQAIAGGLLELERTPGDVRQREIVETIFRAAHSLKGAARAVEYTRIETLCQSLEDMLAAWRRQESAPSLPALDALHGKLNAIADVLAVSQHLSGAATPVVSAAPRPTFDAPRRLPVQAAPVEPRAEPGEISVSVPVLRKDSASPGETVRISVDRLDARLAGAEEMLAVKLGAAQRVADLGELSRHLSAWQGEWAAVEPEVRALQQKIEGATSGRTGALTSAGLERLLKFFDQSQEPLKRMERKVAEYSDKAKQDHDVASRLIDDLLEESKKLLLLPFSTMSASFPKLVRDQCREQGKEADFTIDGESTEIDKRILEEMKDPLMHLLRNCIDHGLETAAERTARGKPSRAMIKLSLSQISGNKVRLLMSDDGAGINIEKVKASAVEQGLISADDAARMDEAEAQELIFRSGVSSSPGITQLSGRGLGLAIVREKANKLGGEVWVDSRRGAGCVFRIELPIARATFRGIVVEAAGRHLVLPTSDVERAAHISFDDIRTVEGRETLSLDGRAMSLVWLADVLELPQGERSGISSGGATVIILGRSDQRVAFVVDELLDEQEVLVKPLLKPLSRVRNVAAATLLGNGKIAPILNVADLLKSARRFGSVAPRLTPSKKPKNPRTVLVAEDSITSRMLIKGILESAGYRVSTAVDGMDAFIQLRAEQFDVLVSDVEMPRLNGFDLTARIRADKKLAEMPVVLVTALETRDDRERGIDVGANAYIVKGSFDQSDLLEALRRLI